MNRIMRKIVLWICLLVTSVLYAQETSLSVKLSQGHPRYLTDSNGKVETQKLIKEEPWAQEVFEKLKQRTDRYADRGPEWLTSRLQMYWKTHATEVYIKGEYYDHAGGEKAPAPTVMYTGARSHATNYVRPKLEDLKPYQEDARGMYLANGTLEGRPYEWVNISKTGNIIQSINVEILGIARDAAFLWWMTGEKKYADLAASVFDTYMTGIYYRNVPKDLNHGHQQTLVGMSSFEVIHEDAVNALVPLYDFLYDYLKTDKADKMDIYAGAFKKWADNIIDNGVPHNNWNLMQARYIMSIGMILESDASYPDKKGGEYYIDYVLNRSSIRQWSLKQLADYGYDAETGIWAECPGYSQVVVGDYTDMVTIFDRNLGMDLTEEIPVIKKAVAADPQYLFPDCMTMGFGDTHPGKLNPAIFARMVANAQKHGKKDQERQFTAMLKLFDPDASKPATEKKNVRVAVTSFFSDKPLVIDDKIPAGDINDYVTPTFYAPNASWLVQRNGMDKRHSPGGAICVIKNDSVLFEKTYGSFTGDTKVYVASAGKWVAAAVIGAVVDRTDLSWDDPVEKWLPQFRGDAKGDILLRQLLSHTSGVRPYLPAPRVDNYNHLDSAVTEILPLDTVFAPGIRFEYGGLAMQIAGRMAEVAMGEEFEFLFQKLIAVPLEMTGSHFTPVNTDGGHAPMLGGGLCTTLNDYIRFLKMIYHNGRFGNKEILKPETVQTMQVDQVRNAVVAPGEYVEKALGQHHTGIYGLGEWRELVDETTGEAYQISSPGWAGAYPWINKRDSVYGFFIAHVQGGANKKDGFSSFYGSPVLSETVTKIVNQ